MGLTIGDIINCALIELLPVIKELFSKKYVSLEVNGTYEEVEQYFKNPSVKDYEKDIQNIFKLYENIVENRAGYLEDDDDYWEEDEIQQPEISIKTGRNDPSLAAAEKNIKNVAWINYQYKLILKFQLR